MSCGIPRVVTDVGDSALLVGDCGIVVPPQDTAGIIRSLAANRTEVVNGARTRIIENFSVQQLAERTADALATLKRPQRLNGDRAEPGLSFRR